MFANLASSPYLVSQEGITAVLTSSATDVLSHVAIRARSQGVLLATCFDEAELESISALAGQHARLSVTPAGAVVATVVEAALAAGTCCCCCCC